MLFRSEHTSESAFFTSIGDFSPHDEGLDVVDEETNLVLLSTAKSAKTNLLLDTQTSIHIICEESLIGNLRQSDLIITVQGITRDITKINHLGHLKTIGILQPEGSS